MSFCVTGGDEWELVAKELGLSQAVIRFLHKRILNQFEAVLVFIAKQRHVTAKCGFPVLADVL